MSSRPEKSEQKNYTQGNESLKKILGKEKRSQHDLNKVKQLLSRQGYKNKWGKIRYADANANFFPLCLVIEQLDAFREVIRSEKEQREILIAIINELIKAGCKLDALRDNGETALSLLSGKIILALTEERHERSLENITQRIDPRSQPTNYQPLLADLLRLTEIVIASRANQPLSPENQTAAKNLVQLVVSVLATSSMEKTVYQNAEAALTQLLALKPELNNLQGEPPLILAAKNRHWRAVMQLLNAGADPNKVDYQGATAFEYVIRFEAPDEVLSAFLNKRAKLNLKRGKLKAVVGQRVAIDDKERNSLRDLLSTKILAKNNLTAPLPATLIADYLETPLKRALAEANLANESASPLDDEIPHQDQPVLPKAPLGLGSIQLSQGPASIFYHSAVPTKVTVPEAKHSLHAFLSPTPLGDHQEVASAVKAFQTAMRAFFNGSTDNEEETQLAQACQEAWQELSQQANNRKSRSNPDKDYCQAYMQMYESAIRAIPGLEIHPSSGLRNPDL